jgi:predicted metal-dependent hydrolase
MNEQVRRFVHLFNVERDFYECHELFEQAWKAETKEPLKSFYKAMVQVATAQFKIRQGYLNGFRKLYGYCYDILAQLPPVFQGIDMAKLCRDFTAQLQQLPPKDFIKEGTYREYGLDFLTLHAAEYEGKEGVTDEGTA